MIASENKAEIDLLHYFIESMACKW